MGSFVLVSTSLEQRHNFYSDDRSDYWWHPHSNPLVNMRMSGYSSRNAFTIPISQLNVVWGHVEDSNSKYLSRIRVKKFSTLPCVEGCSPELSILPMPGAASLNRWWWCRHAMLPDLPSPLILILHLYLYLYIVLIYWSILQCILL